MNRDLGVLDRLPPEADHAVAEQFLLDSGWDRCGVGDWAVVLASPSGLTAARISPFDPVAPYTAELFRRAAGTGQVPALWAYAELDGGAVCTVMERLHPADPQQAAAFFEALGERRAAMLPLVDAIDDVVARARATLPWFGPLDPNPSNVMRRKGGELVLTDPFFADGPNLYGSLLVDASEVAQRIPPEQRRHMFELPLGESGPWDPVERARMRARLAEADQRLGTHSAG